MIKSDDDFYNEDWNNDKFFLRIICSINIIDLRWRKNKKLNQKLSLDNKINYKNYLDSLKIIIQ